MSTKNESFTKYEQAVDMAIKHAVMNYQHKLKLVQSFEENRACWEILPFNSKAAKVYIGNINENTININVDERHWLEFFVNEKKWDLGLEIFEEYLHAFLEGNITGWYQKHSNAENDERPKTLLEIRTGKGKPQEWSGNILLHKKFKKQVDTVSKEYEKY